MGLIFGMVKNNIFLCENSNTYKYKKKIYKIAYDGNMYNLTFMKQELLSKGYYFESSNQDEIILKAFIQYGFDVYQKFAGHFAIVIWDDTNKQLIFMKDYYSIKSIFYKMDDNNIIFSNNLEKILNLANNKIIYSRFKNSFLLKLKLDKENFITEDIKESFIMMSYYNKTFNKIVKDIEYIECGYIFDEVAQIVLNNLDNICIIKLNGNKLNEIDIIAMYILEQFNKKILMISQIKDKLKDMENITFDYSKEKLNWFLSNMTLPFFNMVEYRIMFAIEKVKNIGLIDLLLNETGKNIRFYNIDLLCDNFQVELLFPGVAKKIMLGVEEIYDPFTHNKINQDYMDKSIVEKEYERVKKISKFPVSDTNSYYKMIYNIRLNNWLEKYNIKIV